MEVARLGALGFYLEGLAGKNKLAPSTREHLLDLAEPFEQDRMRALAKLTRTEDVRILPAVGRVLMEDPSPQVRVEAVSTLREVWHANNARYLIPAMKNDLAHEVRHWAARALGKHKVTQAIPELIDAFHRDRHGNARYGIVIGLMRMNDKRANPVLIEALSDSDVHTRNQAAVALGFYPEKAALEPLKRMLAKDTYNLARANAAEALGKIGQKEAMPALKKALNDKEFVVRQKAIIGLGDLIIAHTTNKTLKAKLDQAQKAFANLEPVKEAVLIYAIANDLKKVQRSVPVSEAKSEESKRRFLWKLRQEAEERSVQELFEVFGLTKKKTGVLSRLFSFLRRK